jgi:integrase
MSYNPRQSVGLSVGLRMAALTDKASRNIEPGKTLREGTVKGLTLIGGSRKGEGKWNLRYQLNGRRRDMGLGNFPAVGVAAARLAGAQARAEIAQGIDPIDARDAKRKAARPVPTFAEIAAVVVAEAKQKTTSEKVAYQWERHLGPVYCGPLLDRPVNEITTTDVAEVLRRVWRAKPEVARKLLPNIRRVFEYARIRLRDEHGIVIDNPARWDDLKAMGFEPPKQLTRGRHPSLPYDQMAEFVAALRRRYSIVARMLEFTILTNVRVGAAIGATWDQFDLEAANWTIPLTNLKDKRHRKEALRVPLSARAVALVLEMQAVRTCDYVFPNSKDEPLSNTSLQALMGRMNGSDRQWLDPATGKQIVPHGFRASFRTWAEETTHFPPAVVEEAMGHVVGNAVERAYRRTDVLEQRRALMTAWANHCEPKSGGNIVTFRQPGASA